MDKDAPIPAEYITLARAAAVTAGARAIAQAALDEIKKHGPDPEAIPLIIMMLDRAAELLTKQVSPVISRALVTHMQNKLNAGS